jgi:hypothetical protein
MYRWLRNTHLFLGLFSFLFVLMYAVSSVQMAHNTWFRLRPTVTETQQKIAPEQAGDARAVARVLMDRSVVAGEINEARETPGGYRIRVVRAGAVQEVDYTRADATANIRISKPGMLGMLNRIHHIAGMEHEYQPTNIWAAFVAVISAGLIILAMTGIYLWFKLHQERLIGAVLLALNLGYSLTLMVLIRFAA